ncbi:MAG: amidohydrolase [Alistipes sp.]|nr:amidohydrolase [Alistipes sp.]
MYMKVAVCQYDMQWESAEANLPVVEELIAKADADLVLLPEMFSTGFKLRASCVAEPMEGPTIAAMRGWAEKYQKAVVGSIVIVDEEGKFRNRMLFVKPSGEMTWYDKRHLFRPGGEGRDYTPGKERVIVEYMGVRFLLLICYDLRFPVWSRNRGDYDAILYCASWAADRREPWKILLRARAVENQAYVFGVNRVGDDPASHYAGDSQIIDFRGRILKEVADEEAILVAEIDLKAQERFRDAFPAWQDRDEFTIHL